MSTLLEWIESNPELTPSLIGIDYHEFQQLAEQLGLKVPVSAGVEARQGRGDRPPSVSSLSPELLQYEFSITPAAANLEQTLSPADQLLLLLFCCYQTWTQSTAAQLGISEAALLGYYFGVQEAAVDQLLFTASPWVETLINQSSLNLDRAQVYSRLLNATGFAHDAQDRLRLFQKLGFAPSHIFDVGASNGSWTRVIHQLFPQAHFYLFEPLAPFSQSYQLGLDFVKQTIPLTLFPYALGSECGTTRIAIAPDLASSSILTAEREITDTVQEIPLMTLDAVIQQHELPYPQLIKLDTQGYELNILSGATETLKHVELLMVESWLIRGYGEKTPLLLELAAWLDQHDFCLLDLGGSYRNPSGILVSPDCYFVKRSSPLANQGFDRKLDFSRIQ